MKVDPRGASRDRILYLLKTRGPQGATALARQLGMTAAGARQHLAKLQQDGLVTHAPKRGAVGRPRRVYALTPRADALFPEGHGDLAVDLIAAIRDALGPGALDALVRRRKDQQLARYRDRLDRAGPDLARRVAALAKARSDEGYLAQWTRHKDGSFTLIENHCPICAAARACQNLCTAELELFEQALGNVRVERTEHLLQGARRCVYRIAAKPA